MKWLTNILPVTIGCLVSWGIYVMFMDMFNIMERVEGNSARLALVLWLTYILTLLLAFNHKMFQKAVSIYILSVAVIIVTNEQLNIVSNLFVMIAGSLLGFLGFITAKLVSYVLNKFSVE